MSAGKVWPTWPSTFTLFQRYNSYTLNLELSSVFNYKTFPHADDLRKRRSTTGYAFILSGAAVAYKSKTQTITATSSTEAEFIAAVAYIILQIGYESKKCVCLNMRTFYIMHPLLSLTSSNNLRPFAQPNQAGTAMQRRGKWWRTVLWCIWFSHI